MATVVDALLVTLGLDPSGLKAGAQEAKGEMAELQEKSKELAEKTKREQKEFAEAVKTSSDAVSAFQTKAAEEAALAAAKVHELQKAASQPGAGKAAASEVKAAIAAQNAARAAASEQLKKLQTDAQAAGIKLSDCQRKAAQEAEELKKKMKEVEHEAKEMAEKLKENGEKGAEMFDMVKEHAVEFLGIMASVGAFMAFTEHTIKAGAEMLHLSEAIGMDTEEISKWQNAVVIAGGSAEGLNSNLKTLGGSLVDIEKGLPRAKRALVAFNAIGITNLGKGKHVEIGQVFEQLHEKMSNGKMSLMEAMELGKKVGITDEALIRTLHKGGEAYEEMMAKAKAAGTVSKEQAEASEKAEEGMNEFKISMQRAMELIVQLALPAITAVSGALTKVSQWAHEHSGAIQAAIMGIVGGLILMNVQAIIAGVQMAFTWAITTAGAIAAQFAFLQAGIAAAWAWVMASGGLILVVAGIALLIGGMVKLYNSFEGFRSVVQSVFGWIKNYILTVFNAIWDTAKSVFDAIGDAVDLIVGIFTFNGDKIKTSWHKLWDDIKAAVHMAWMIILFQILSAAIVIVNTVNMIWPAIKAGLTSFVEAWKVGFRQIVASVFGVVGDLFDAWKAGMGLLLAPVLTVWASIKAVFTGAAHAVGAMVMGAFHAVGEGFHALVGAATGAGHEVVSRFNNAFHNLVALASAVWTGIKGIFAAEVQGVVNIGKALVTGFEAIFNGMLKVVHAVWLMIKDLFTGNISGLVSDGRALLAGFEGIFQAIAAVAEAVWEAIRGVVMAGVNAVIGIGKTLLAPFTGIFNGILSAGKAVWTGIKEAAAAPLQWIEEKLGGVLKLVGKAMSLFHKGAATAAVAVAAHVAPAAPTQAAPVPVTSNAHPANRSQAHVAPAAPTQAPKAKAYEDMTIGERLAKFKEQSDAYDAKHRPAEGGVQQLLDMQKQARSASVKTNTTSNINKETHIGAINVQTAATDAPGIAKDIGGAIQSHGLVDHADGGMV